MNKKTSSKKSLQKSKTRYIFVLGGVISGLGKGVTSGSIAAILKEMGYNKITIKAITTTNNK